MARTITKEQIAKALDQLNAEYGRGNIIHVRHYSKEVVFKCTSCRPQTAKFRVERRTVFFRGHRLTISK